MLDANLYDSLARALAETPSGRAAMRRALASFQALGAEPMCSAEMEHIKPGGARWRLRGDTLRRIATPASGGRAYLRSVAVDEFAAASRSVAHLSLARADRAGVLLSVTVDRRPESATHRAALVLSVIPRPSGAPAQGGDRGSGREARGGRGMRGGRAHVMPITTLQGAHAILYALIELHPAGAMPLVTRGNGDGMGTEAVGRRRGSYCSGPRVRATAAAIGAPRPGQAGGKRSAWLDSFVSLLVQGLTERLRQGPVDIRGAGSEMEDF